MIRKTLLALAVLALLAPLAARANEAPATEIYNLVQRGPHVCVVLAISGDYCVEDVTEGEDFDYFRLDRDSGLEDAVVFEHRLFSREEALEEMAAYTFLFVAADSCPPTGETVYRLTREGAGYLHDEDAITVAPWPGACEPVGDDFCLDLDLHAGSEAYREDDPAPPRDGERDDDDSSGGCQTHPASPAFWPALALVLAGLAARRLARAGKRRF